MFDSVTRILNQFEILNTPPFSARRNRARRACTELLELRQLLSANFQLVKDINTGLTPAGSRPEEYVTIGSTTYFVATTNFVKDLWRTDGTVAGTWIVKRLQDGGFSSPSSLTVLNGTLYFWADGRGNGVGLWKSDGTSSGTVFVKSIPSVQREAFTNVGGVLYFAARDTNGEELWRSDGTAAGTLMVKDIYGGSHKDLYFDNISGVPQLRDVPNSSNPTELINIGGTLYFTATNGTVGKELWKSDGTAAGTVVIRDIAGGSVSEYVNFPYGWGYTKIVPNDSSPEELINFGGTLYFTANDGVAGKELWRSDGTAAGTTIVKDIRSGAGDSTPGHLTDAGGALFFTANNGASGRELWKTDGTVAGTTLVRDIRSGVMGSYPNSLTSIGGILYFSANDGTSGVELWKSNGTVAGTAMVRNIRPLGEGSYPYSFTNVGGMLYFSANDGSSGSELWKSNGTAAGTVIVKDINPGTESSWPSFITNVNGRLCFTADDGSRGDELFVSNGTASGTLLINLESENGIGSHLTGFTNVGATLYFVADDGVNGRELWKSDGTSNGTFLIRDIYLGASDSFPESITSVGNVVYFTASDSSNGRELWKTNGTASGTVLVRNISSGNASSAPADLTNVGGTLYFTASDGLNGRELWKSDGTSAGTVMVKDIVSGNGSSDPTFFVNHGGMLYFTANGTEIWKSDGTAVGTVMVKDIDSAGNAKVTGVGGLLYFLADNGGFQELWKSDGTSAGTILVKTFGDGTTELAGEFINVAGTLYFPVSTFHDGEELWKSDGTESGTVMVKDIFPGETEFVNISHPNSATPRSLTNLDGMLYFVASDGTGGKGIWRSDGTALGTVKVRDAGVDSTLVHAVGNRLFASLSSEDYGSELHTMMPQFGTAGNDAITLNYLRVGVRNYVTVTRSTDGGAVTTLGTFSTDVPLFVDGLGGNDTVRIAGTSYADTITINSNSTVTVNGASLVLTRVEARILTGAVGNDVYRFDADTALGIWTLDEVSDGKDTIDFSLTTTVGLSLNLATAVIQSVHPSNLSLSLGSGVTFENAVGGSGGDMLRGNSLPNTLTGGPGSDHLIGAAGDDTYLFSPASVAEADQVTENLNEGSDTLNFSALGTTVTLNMGANSVQPVHANRTLKLNSPITFENAIGGSGADTLIGNSLNNILNGGAGVDTLNGALGSDVLTGGTNSDTYLFGPASVAEADQVNENPNEGFDTLSFATVTTSIVLNLGANSVQSVHANRTLKLNSPMTFENVVGGSGADTLIGNALNNVLTGGPGDDKLTGAAGSDRLFGGANNDTYQFGPASAVERDLVTENANEGIDTLNFAFLTTDVLLNLGSTAIQAVHSNRTLTLNSGSTFENAIGGSGHDTLLGNVLANRLTGGNGNNILVGMEAGDILEAGSGRDMLIGGLGADTLNGGAGEDILIAGRTTSDTSLGNLFVLRTQWTSANPYHTRIASLRIGAGSPPVSLKTKINVLDDAAAVDRLAGGSNADWYFRALNDIISDLVAGEILDVL